MNKLAPTCPLGVTPCILVCAPCKLKNGILIESKREMVVRGSCCAQFDRTPEQLVKRWNVPNLNKRPKQSASVLTNDQTFTSSFWKVFVL